MSGFPVTVSALLSDFKHRCIKFTVAAVISLLLLLLVAGVLLAYYCKWRIYLVNWVNISEIGRLIFFWFLSWIPVSSSCIHGIKCGDGNRKWESQWCAGVTDCPAGQDEANCGKQLHGGKKKLLYPPPLDLFNKAEWNTLIRTWFQKRKTWKTTNEMWTFWGGSLMLSHSRTDKISFWSLFCCIFCFIAHKIFAKGDRSGLQVGPFSIWTTGTLHCLAEMNKTKDISGKDIFSMYVLCCPKSWIYY